MTGCYGSRRVSRRMRQALEEFRDAGGVADHEPGDVDGDPSNDMESGSLELRVVALEEENHGLRQSVESQGIQLEELARRVAALEGTEEPVVDSDAGQPGDVQGNDQGQDWRPPRRRPGMPDAGVVTLDLQPDEEHAFGQAAPLVKEWRELRVGGDQVAGRVDQGRATVRRWEMEAEMLEDFHLTLPPETHPLDDERRADHVRWRREALAEARRELARAERARWMRRTLSFGLWSR